MHKIKILIESDTELGHNDVMRFIGLTMLHRADTVVLKTPMTQKVIKSRSGDFNAKNIDMVASNFS